MSRISETFKKAKDEGRGVCIPYLTIGFPEIDSTASLALALLESGADIVELGVPFSDPMADGPTIQQASFVALQNGVTRQKCFDTASAIRAGSDKPLIFMGYYNPVFSYGVEKYVKECAEAGIDGLIIPDLALEEAPEVNELCRKYGIDLIQFVAPTSTDERIKHAVELASGFIYCVSITGVTGARTSLPEYLPAYIAKVRSYTEKPLVIGFGISKPEHFAGATALADGAICASALIDRLEKAPPGQLESEAVQFIRELTGSASAA